MSNFSTSDRLYKKLYNFFAVHERLNLTRVAFNKPWWRLIFQQRKLFSIIIFNELLQQVFISLIPLVIGYVLQQRSFELAFALFALWAILLAFENIAFAAGTEFILRGINSIYYQAHRRLLTADPAAHAMKSSGMINAKIERATKAFEDVSDILCFEMAPTLIRSTTIIITLSRFSLTLSFGMGCALLIYAVITSWAYLKIINLIAPRKFAAFDESRALGNEHLMQHSLIRSCFASDEMDTRLKKSVEKAMFIEGTGWRTYQTLRNLMSYGYISIVGALVWYVLVQSSAGNMSIITATTLTLSFITSTVDVTKICRRVYHFMKNATALDDLYSFIESFAVQSFPVLHDEQKTDLVYSNTSIDIQLDSISFGYPGHPALFENMSFGLRIPLDTPNKLFGIIGPSGAGKTTFISLLGGQIKPTQGGVFINGISIYNITDAQRRQLIGIQQQTASSMRGTVRSNVLFGLPAHYQVSDKEIVELLTNIGLWEIFEYKQGLETFVGEGGLTISGGQRQRLNFANLYLRAKCYKPVVLLIDEPTSSLDKLSEQAITNMIHELARNAVVFVIAHRLETLQYAAACIDLSIVSLDNHIRLATFDELKQNSAFFNQLLEHQELLANE